MDDMERALLLLSLIEKLGGHGPKYAYLRTAAFEELEHLNSPPERMEEPQGESQEDDRPEERPSNPTPTRRV